jgi:predicted HTH domain antitoxin
MAASQQRKQAHETTVLALWEAREISAGEAAEELGLSRHEFLDLLAQRGIPFERGPLDQDAINAACRKFAKDRP